MSSPVWRVRDRASFVALRRAGRRVRHGAIAVTWAPAVAPGPPRVAYTVGRRCGGAVVRNRLRRRLRAAVAELADQLAPGIYAVTPAPEAVTCSYPQLRAELGSAVTALRAGVERGERQ